MSCLSNNLDQEGKDRSEATDISGMLTTWTGNLAADKVSSQEGNDESQKSRLNVGVAVAHAELELGGSAKVAGVQRLLVTGERTDAWRRWRHNERLDIG